MFRCVNCPPGIINGLSLLIATRSKIRFSPSTCIKMEQNLNITSSAVSLSSSLPPASPHVGLTFICNPPATTVSVVRAWVLSDRSIALCAASDKVLEQLILVHDRYTCFSSRGSVIADLGSWHRPHRNIFTNTSTRESCLLKTSRRSWDEVTWSNSGERTLIKLQYLHRHLSTCPTWLLQCVQDHPLLAMLLQYQTDIWRKITDNSEKMLFC